MTGFWLAIRPITGIGDQGIGGRVPIVAKRGAVDFGGFYVNLYRRKVVNVALNGGLNAPRRPVRNWSRQHLLHPIKSFEEFVFFAFHPDICSDWMVRYGLFRRSLAQVDEVS